ncbi:MAG: NFACT family protein [Clostridiales bacterium]|jgi:predicted ribosome quality control (RQC) complex YloA/Tae2 family protein|nr:NFACT family protein [Clostridiales bacterium]
MPNDLITLNVLTLELNDILAGGKIDKITQPERNTVTLSVRNNAKNYTLLLSCAPGMPRIHLTRQKKENPKNAPAFCMLLRKYLERSAIRSVSLLGGDRIIALICEGKNELYDPVNLSLVLELMSRHSNIFLLSGESRILGTAKPAFLSDDNERLLIAGAPYSPPKNGKTALDDADGIRKLLLSRDSGGFRPFFAGNIGGVSKETADEIAFRAGLFDAEFPIDGKRAESVISVAKEFCFLADSEKKSPRVLFKNGVPVDFFVTEYRHLNPSNPRAPYGRQADLSETESGSNTGFGLYAAAPKTPNYASDGSLNPPVRWEYARFAALNEAADCFYTEKERLDSAERKARVLNGVLARSISKVQKKIADDKNNIFLSENAEKFKKYGELILNDIYRARKNTDAVILTDYENGKNISVPLSPELTPAENAAAYFKKYSKLKRTGENAKKNLAQNSAELEYLLSVRATVELAESPAHFSEIESELAERGLIKPSRGGSENRNHGGGINASNQRKDGGGSGKCYRAIDEKSRGNGGGDGKSGKNGARNHKGIDLYECEYVGFKIYAGRNNVQSDYATFSLAKGGDIWLHVKNYHGGHVIIAAEGRAVPDSVIAAAAGLAVYFSQARGSSKIPVDYTERRNVKRSPAGKGTAVYSDFKTVLADSFLIKRSF